jgi:outer membrane protein OmpA-like peptidoglycan-associated protein
VTPPPLKLNNILRVGVATFIKSDSNHLNGDEWHLGRLRVEYSLVGSESFRELLYDSSDASFGIPSYPLPYYFKTGTRAPWWGPQLVNQNNGETEDTPATYDPLASQRKADAVCAQRLLDHIRTNQAYYWSLILMNRPPNEYAVEFDKISYRSGTLLEHADFHPIAVFGDYIVFPLNARTGSTSSGSLAKDLLASQIEPIHTFVNLPTRGVLAEAKLSDCNACEEIDETRFWNWAESPCTDEAPTITGVSPGSRARDIDTRPSELPSPVVNIVNPPAAPDPTGLAAAMNVIGTPNIFRDMSGRQELSSLLQRLTDGTISMAQARRDAQRLQQQPANANTAASPGGATRQNAREIIGQDQAVTQAIRRAQNSGSITPAEARGFTRQHIGNVLANESERAGTGTGSSTTYPDTNDWGTGPVLVPTVAPEHRRLGAFIFLYNFPVDGVELQPFHRQSLDGILGLLSRLESYNISLIEGHASDTGAADPERREAHNMELSRLRGESARRYLVDGGFPDELISTVEALGDNAPIRVTSEDMNQMRRRGYRGTEDELNRSVVLRFEATILQPLTPQTRIDVPVPRYELPRYQHWEMLLTVEFAAGEGGGGAAIHIRIRPRGVPPEVQDREVTEFLYVGIGFFGELALPVEGGDLNDWDSFDTERPIQITDFYFQPAVITEPFTAGVIWQISLFNYFYLPLLMNDLRQAADLGGIAYGIGVSSSVHAGMLLPIGHATLLMP